MTTDKRNNRARGEHHVRIYQCRSGDGLGTARIRQIFPSGGIKVACVHANLIEESYLCTHNHPAATQQMAKIQQRINLETAFKANKSALSMYMEGSQTSRGRDHAVHGHVAEHEAPCLCQVFHGPRTVTRS
jgi:hypothetical protein